MTREERHQRVSLLFALALEHAQAHREEVLRRECQDEDILHDVLELLERDNRIEAAKPRRSVISEEMIGSIVKVCPSCHRCFDGGEDACPSDGSQLKFAFAGTTVIDSKYQLQRLLAVGGMGAVYEARHRNLNRASAVKLISYDLSRDQSFRRHFRTEAEALGRLDHPNVVRVHDSGVDPTTGMPYLVTELLKGETLKKHVHLCRVSVGQALEILSQIASAVDYAHSRGVLHLDLKPTNVFLIRDGDGGRPTAKVLDFGVAVLLRKEPVSSLAGVQAAVDGGNHNGHPVRVGTPSYMAPELLTQALRTPAADIFSLGVIAYELLVGVHPFQSESLMPWCAERTRPKAPSASRQDLPWELDEPLLSMLAAEPSGRPHTAGAAIGLMCAAWLAARRRLWREREIPRRLIWAFALGVAIVTAAVWGNHRGFAEVVENWSMDQRYRLLPAKPPDPRILLVVFDERSMKADLSPLSDRAEAFTRNVKGVFDAGARAVGVDLLLPEKWADSPTFSDFVVRQADRLTLAVSFASGEGTGAFAVNRLVAMALGPERYVGLFGDVDVESEGDRVIRFGRHLLPDNKERPGAFAAVVVSRLVPLMPVLPPSGGKFWIDYSTDWRQIPRISWKDLPARLNDDPKMFAGRLVLIGGEYAGAGDNHYVPQGLGGGESVSGVVLQSLLINTVLSGFPVRSADLWIVWPLVGLGCLALVAFTLCWPSSLGAASVFGMSCLAYLLAASAWFRVSQVVVPLMLPLSAMLLAFSAALVVRRFLPGYPQDVVT